MAFVAVIVLWTDVLALYVMWIMQTYLTNVWHLGFVHAAGIMNIANGLSKALALPFYCSVDAGFGNKRMLLLSSISYLIGLGLVSMSTPPILAKATGTCKMYEPQCVGHVQKTLFYTALAFIAVGLSGRIVSLAAVFVDDLRNKPLDINPTRRPMRTRRPLPPSPTMEHIPTMLIMEPIPTMTTRRPMQSRPIINPPSPPLPPIPTMSPEPTSPPMSPMPTTTTMPSRPNMTGISHSVDDQLDIIDYKQEVPPQSERTQILIEEIQKIDGGVNASFPNYRFPPLPPAAPLPDSLNNISQKIKDRRYGFGITSTYMQRLEVNKSEQRENALGNLGKTLEDSDGIVPLNLQFPPVDALLALLASMKKRSRSYLIVITPAIAVFTLPYIKPWSLRFGIPAICTVVATAAFLMRFHFYKEEKRSKQIPVTNILKVTIAACVKMFKRLPSSSELYENSISDSQKLPPTNRLRFLDKAAIQEGPLEKLMLCTVTEVEETKIIFHMFPIWISFILCGVVASLGSTYFLEQAKHMNYKLGKLKLPDSLLLILHASSKIIIAGLLRNVNKYPHRRGIALATITATLCCIIAALVESKRREVIRDHGLIDKPDEKIPMTVFWLLPQYFVLGAMDSFYENSAAHFLHDQGPPSMRKCLVFLSPGLSGIGIIGSVLSVDVVGRVSRRHGKPGWFQHDLNASRLDRYYWTLAGLSAVNFLWFFLFASIYPYRYISEPDADEEKVEIDASGNIGRKRELIRKLRERKELRMHQMRRGIGGRDWS